MIMNFKRLERNQLHLHLDTYWDPGKYLGIDYSPEVCLNQRDVIERGGIHSFSYSVRFNNIVKVLSIGDEIELDDEGNSKL
jgi:hypothetical protein